MPIHSNRTYMAKEKKNHPLTDCTYGPSLEKVFRMCFPLRLRARSGCSSLKKAQL